jgi:hypothetical protein
MSVVSIGFVDRTFSGTEEAKLDSKAFDELRKGMTL